MSAKIFRLKIPKEEHTFISLPITFNFIIISGKRNLNLSPGEPPIQLEGSQKRNHLEPHVAFYYYAVSKLTHN